MGFRHKYTPEDKVQVGISISALEAKANRSESENEELKQLRDTQKEIDSQIKIQALEKRINALEGKKEPSAAELKERDDAKKELRDLRKELPVCTNSK